MIREFRKPYEKIRYGMLDLRTCCEGYNKLGYTICLTTGAYDLIHEGHVRYLLQAAELADIFIVGVDSDKLVRERKKEGRPIVPQGTRAFILSAFECIDQLLVHDDSLKLVKTVRPDIFVVSRSTGVDIEKERKDCSWVRNNGGKIVVFDRMSDNHTTKVIESVRNTAK